MPEIIISDTSCLIILNNIGELELLHQLYKTVTVTRDIQLEYGKKLPDWIEVKQVNDPYRQQLLEMRIDKGEASAIALALETVDSRKTTVSKKPCFSELCHRHCSLPYS